MDSKDIERADAVAWARQNTLKTEAPAEAVADAAQLAAELAAAIQHAEGELSQHIETYHDYEDETPESTSLRGIQHHLAGSLMGEDGQLLAIFKHPAPSLSTRGEADARTYEDGVRDGLEMATRKATSFLVGDPANGVPLRNPMAHEVAAAIRALVPEGK